MWLGNIMGENIRKIPKITSSYEFKIQMVRVKSSLRCCRWLVKVFNRFDAISWPQNGRPLAVGCPWGGYWASTPPGCFERNWEHLGSCTHRHLMMTLRKLNIFGVWSMIGYYWNIYSFRLLKCAKSNAFKPTSTTGEWWRCVWWKWDGSTDHPGGSPGGGQMAHVHHLLWLYPLLLFIMMIIWHAWLSWLYI